MKLAPQIVRLLLLTIAIVGSYVLARAMLTPPSFGEYGFFRGDAIEEIRAREPVYAGRKSCAECHDVIAGKLAKGDHRTISCESCHGAAAAHADNPNAVKPVKGGDSLCLRCHEADPSRPAWLKQVVSTKHYEGRCVECHVPHQPKEVP